MSAPLKRCIKKLATGLLLCPLAWSFAAQSEDLVESIPEAAERARIAIIIDDLGYSMPPAKAILELPFPITMAIIPFTPYGKNIAKKANSIDREVMLHAPMETLATNKWEKSLNVDMDEIELFSTIDAMLSDIPFVVGVNNHGGSKLTQDRDRMNWIMSFLAERNLFFIDSRTIAASVAVEAAQHNAIAYNKRDVFIDNEKTRELIEAQIDLLSLIALEQGQAIGIGHPYPETAEALSNKLPRLKRSGISLVYASRLAKQANPAPRLALHPPLKDQQLDKMAH